MPGDESYPPPGGSYPPPGTPPPDRAQDPTYPTYPPPSSGQPHPAPPYPGQAFPGQQYAGQQYAGQQYPGAPAYAVPGPPPGMLGAAHKPGAIALRPLGLGDLYDGAFRIIRYNPKVTVGAPVLVSAVALLLPVLLTALLSWGAGLTLDPESNDLSRGDVVAIVAIVGSLAVGALGQFVGTLLVTGMIAHVVLAAAVGRRLGLGEAWRATHGKRWRILGLTLLLALAWVVAGAVYVGLWFVALQLTDSTAALVVFGVVMTLAAAAVAIFLYVRVTYLAIATLVLEDVGVLGAYGRAFRLTRGAFWRTFGIALLTTVVAQVAAAVLTCPLGILAGVVSVAVPPEHEFVASIVLQALSTVLSAALVTPFMTTVSTLQYVDLRMRQEAFDVELMNRAGITAS